MCSGLSEPPRDNPLVETVLWERCVDMRARMNKIHTQRLLRFAWRYFIYNSRFSHTVTFTMRRLQTYEMWYYVERYPGCPRW